MSPPMAEVRDAVAERGDAMQEFLTRLVRLETPSLDASTQAAALDQLAEGLTVAGLRVRRVRGRSSGGMLLGRAPGSGPYQLLLGHCDTVWPLGTLESMPVREHDGRLYGPGVFDMKCGLTQLVYALQVLRELGVEPAVTPVVLINSDEEIGSRDSFTTIERLARRVERVYVLEPSLTPGGRLKTSRKGVQQFEIVVTGRAAHAGLNPEAGISAILELAHLTQQLFALNDAARGISVNVGTIDGGMRPNVIAPRARASVDVRVPTVADDAAVHAAIRALQPTLEGAKIEVRHVEGRAPMEPDEGARRLWSAAQRLAGELGFELDEGRAGGGSDGNITSQFVSTLDGLGAVGDGAHAAHEHVVIEHIVQRTALLVGLLMEPSLG